MLKLLRRLAPCLALLGFLAPSWAQTLPQGVAQVRSVEGIDEYRLANGLQILLVPDDSKKRSGPAAILYIPPDWPC